MINNIKNQTGRSLYLNCTKDTQSSFEQRVPNRYTSKRVASRFAQIGRSMIEMLGVLAIIGVLSVGGIAGYSKAMMKYRVNKTIDQITMISTNIRTLFGPQGNYVGLNESVLIKAKAIPDEMIVNNRDLVNAFGASFGIGAARKTSTESNNENHAFIIHHFRGIPNEACIALATQDWNDEALNFGINTDPHSFDLCESGASKGAAVHCGKDRPMSVSDAVKACSSGNNDILWLFY